GHLHTTDVYRSNLRRALTSLLHGVAALVSAGRRGPRPASLLDCPPLADLLSRLIDFTRIRRAIESGQLRALCITASSYTSGDSISFFQDDGSREPWRRARRGGRRTQMRRAPAV